MRHIPSTDQQRFAAEQDSTMVLVALTRDELTGLANALLQTLAAVEEWEFETLIGLTPVEAENLKSEIVDLMFDTREPQ